MKISEIQNIRNTKYQRYKISKIQNIRNTNEFGYQCTKEKYCDSNIEK